MDFKQLILALSLFLTVILDIHIAGADFSRAEEAKVHSLWILRGQGSDLQLVSLSTGWDCCQLKANPVEKTELQMT